MTKLTHPFNSAIECGLRTVIVLEEAFPKSHDLQTLVLYDYFLVHSGDANGPKSIHPATPHRSGEMLIKRQLLERGLSLFMSRDLIKKHYTPEGISYSATEMSTSFLDNLGSSYVIALKDRASWIIKTFQHMPYSALEQYFYNNLDRWGGEFEKEAIFKYVTP